jgi:DNA polymerase-1
MRLYHGVHLLDRPSPANALRLDLGAMPMIQEMHRRGIWLNPDVLTSLSSDLAARNAEIQSKIDGWVGRPFQSTSPEQVAKLLFDELNLLEQWSPPGRMKMTKGGAKKPPRPSVDDDALSKFADVHPVVGLIQEQRAVLKLKNTYADPLLLMRDEVGRLHTTFRTTQARTGRLTSEDPNLQNVPIRTEDGRRVREAFQAQPDLNTVLGSTDLSQIEMRVAAHLSGDSAMSEVFHLDQDIHLKTVCSVYGYNYDSLTGLWRAYKSGEISGADLERARDLDINKRLPLKSVGFGVLYRQQAEGLQSSIVGNGGPLLPIETCQSHIDNWFGAYPAVPIWMSLQDQRACRYGMVWDMFGRIRLIPGVRSALPYIRARALREAGNMPVQAGAQGIIKLAMAAIMPLVLAYQALGVICWPLLQIHDELIFELDRHIAIDFLSEAREIMESIVPLSVPVRASQSIGQNWKELK